MPTASHAPRRPYRAVPSLTAHPLYQAIRGCEACSVRSRCAGPVPGVGPRLARVMLVGEAPGENEDRYAIPFTGATWQELQSLLLTPNLTRDDVYLTNVLKCRPGKDDPTDSQTQFCADVWLEAEIAMVQPEVIVALGQQAIRVLLGDPDATVEAAHGYPVWSETWSCWIFPSYHPAASFYDTALLRFLQADMLVLRDLLDGRVREKPVDEYAGNELYQDLREEAPDSGAISRLQHYLSVARVLALDTESLPDGSLYCLSVSWDIGEAVVLSPTQLPLLQPFLLDPDRSLIMHNALYDWAELRRAGIQIRARVRDTWTLARELQLETGRLKDLARRYLGMAMEDYMDLVSPYQPALSEAYLRRALEIAPQIAASKPELVVEWDAKTRRQKARIRKPQSLLRKLTRLMKDLEEGKSPDLLDRWKNYEEEERRAVQGLLGPFPLASLADVPQPQVLHYSARDADSTLRLFDFLYEQARAANLLPIFEDIDTPAMAMLADMEQAGMAADIPYLEGVVDDLQGEMVGEEVRAWGMAGKPFNLGSTHQVGEILYRDMGVPITVTTETGLPSTDDAVLVPLRSLYPIITPVLEYRKRAKLTTAYGLPLLQHARRDPLSRVHPDLGGMALTGRVNGRGPNLLALPKRTAEGKLIRNAFYAQRVQEGHPLWDYWCWDQEMDPDTVYISADYSQIEMRVMAHESKCRLLIDAFQKGEDVHMATARIIYRKDSPTKDERDAAKNVNFGVIYGIGEAGLLVQFDQRNPGAWTLESCAQLLAQHREIYPEIPRFGRDKLAEARRTGHVTDMWGRRRALPEVRSPRQKTQNEGARYAINFPVQAGAQGITKLAMAELWRRTEEARLHPQIAQSPCLRFAQPVLQVHDQLIFETLTAAREEVAQIVREVMEGVVELLVPTPVDVGWGVRLGELKE